MGLLYRLDANGRFFDFPTCKLEKQEYAKIINEINSNYGLYKDLPFAIHYSIGTDNRYYIYYFENHGFNDYNIVEKFAF
ncbi:MAG: hypothetical protein J6Y57_02340 [Lachnospiraceae bacterium]|nr:hypothetical protein [Lachnospiraceae bacterium]